MARSDQLLDPVHTTPIRLDRFSPNFTDAERIGFTDVKPVPPYRYVYDVPDDIDREVARLKLKAMGIAIDTLTEEQQRYLTSWEEGT